MQRTVFSQQDIDFVSSDSLSNFSPNKKLSCLWNLTSNLTAYFEFWYCVEFSSDFHFSAKKILVIGLWVVRKKICRKKTLMNICTVPLVGFCGTSFFCEDLVQIDKKQMNERQAWPHKYSAKLSEVLLSTWSKENGQNVHSTACPNIN